MSDRLESHYRREGNRYLIELHLSEPRRLFNSLDPAPFRDKDLDPAAEDYLVDAVQEFQDRTPLKLVLRLPGEQLAQVSASGLETAVHHYFDYRREATTRRLQKILRDGRMSLLIGLSFLLSCIVGRRLLQGLEPAALLEILEEGLLICGWVAMWRPIQIFLYDWWPVRRRIRIHRRLSRIPVEVRAA